MLSFFQDVAEVAIVVAEVALTQSLSPASLEVSAQPKVARIFNLGKIVYFSLASYLEMEEVFW